MRWLAGVLLALVLHGPLVVTTYEDGSVTYDDGTSACVHPDYGCTP